MDDVFERRLTPVRSRLVTLCCVVLGQVTLRHGKLRHATLRSVMSDWVRFGSVMFGKFRCTQACDQIWDARQTRGGSEQPWASIFLAETADCGGCHQ